MELTKSIVKKKFSFLKKYGFKLSFQRGAAEIIAEYANKKNLSIFIWYCYCIREFNIKNNMSVGEWQENAYWDLAIILKKNNIQKNIFDCEVFNKDDLFGLKSKLKTKTALDQLNEYAIFIEKYIDKIMFEK